MPVFMGFRRLQGLLYRPYERRNGIPKIVTVFRKLERNSEENNGILEAGTVF